MLWRQQGSLFHHIWIDLARRISGMNQRTISARFQTNSHCQYPLEARVIYWITLALSYCGIFYSFQEAVGSRKASSSYLDAGSILSKCGFSRLKGLLQADKIQAFILMSLVFKTIHSPNVATSSLAFPFSLVSMKADVCYTRRPIITIDQVDRLDSETSLCLFVPDHISYLSRLLGRNVGGFSPGLPVQAFSLAVICQTAWSSSAHYWINLRRRSTVRVCRDLTLST